jgi:hypothetical protein
MLCIKGELCWEACMNLRDITVNLHWLLFIARCDRGYLIFTSI